MSVNSILSKGITMMNPKFSRKIKNFHYKRVNRRGQKTFFSNVECPSCNSTIAYITWQKNYSAGFCPDCNEEWLES
jgi:ssDNA-binding Zn-finger/Zn-ribbon topoisomerase 1